MNVQSLFLMWVAAVSFSNVQQPSLSAECPEYDRVLYSARQKDWSGSIAVESVRGQPRLRSGTQTDLQRSPQGTASYIVRKPDTTKPGPWTTVVEVFGNKARPIHLRIRIADHSSGGVRTRWLNEKLLWLQAWWGRIVSTDVILDVETGRFVYEQDANYNGLIVPCSMKAGVPK